MHWFYDPNLTEQSTALRGSEGKHAAAVLRIRSGEQLAITNGLGRVVFATAEDVDTKVVNYRVTQVKQLEPGISVHLVQALAKGDRDELAVQAATELGATEFTPWQAERSISRWTAEKAVKGVARWLQIAIEATKQSQRAYVPHVNSLATTQQLLSLSGPRFVLDPLAQQSILDAGVQSDFTIVVGPEGGISDEELASFEKAGFLRINLGSGILRTSTAGPAAITALKVLARAI